MSSISLAAVKQSVSDCLEAVKSSLSGSSRVHKTENENYDVKEKEISKRSVFSSSRLKGLVLIALLSSFSYYHSDKISKFLKSAFLPFVDCTVVEKKDGVEIPAFIKTLDQCLQDFVLFILAVTFASRLKAIL